MLTRITEGMTITAVLLFGLGIVIAAIMTEWWEAYHDRNQEDGT